MLMYSKDDNVVTRQELNDMRPDIIKLHTRSHKPVPFGDAIDLVHDEVERAGFIVGDEQHVLARKQTQLFSMLELQNVRDKFRKICVAVRHSINKTLSLQVAIAKTLLICTNLSLWAREFIARKNTRFVSRDIRAMIRGYVGRIDTFIADDTERTARYQSALLADPVANHTIIRMLQNGVINTQRVETVVNEFYNPSHVEHLNENGERTAWTLFNAATESFKGSPISTYTERCNGLHAQVDQAATYALRNA